ncbi:MAG: hypothetical protein ACRDRP_26350, partial [Pseudonocardiaceae bacterium]
PLDRWLAGPSALRPAPDLAELAEAFRWQATRTVTRTPGVSLRWRVTPTSSTRPWSAGGWSCATTLQDLTKLAVWYQGQPAGEATPRDIKAHVDPKLRQANPPEPGPPTGIAYLEAVAADHAAALAGGVAYHQPSLPLPDLDDPQPDPQPRSDDVEEEPTR